MSTSWFVVQTQVRAEEKSAAHLFNQGFDVYLPRYQRRVRHARRIELVLRPLFPGYLFVNLDPNSCRWLSINGTVGVRRIIAQGSTPQSVPDFVIEGIKSREDGDGTIRLVAPSFVRGQAVRITDGPLADMSGLFEEMRDENRSLLLISLLGRKVRIQVSTEALMSA